MNAPPLLEINNISLKFGGNVVLYEVSFKLSEGNILGLIGPNGAGKTSILNCITSFYQPFEGEILLNGLEISRRKAHQIPNFGISRTFQNIELFSGLTVLENLMAGRHILMKSGFVASSVFFGRARREEIRHREVVEQIIDLLEMQSIRDQLVGTLPYGLRKRVDFGRALAAEPKLLLLDEPLAGMNVEEKEDMVRFILDTHELKGTPIIMVEHDMGVVMDIVDQVVALDFGRKIAEGTPAEIKQNEQVIKAYLGKSGD